MNFIQLVSLALLTCIIIIIVKHFRPEFVVAITICAGLGFLAICITQLIPFINYFKDISEKTAYSEYFGVMIKGLGIGLLTQFASDICRDSGEVTLANKVELAGKIELLVISLPLIKKIIELSEEILFK